MAAAKNERNIHRWVGGQNRGRAKIAKVDSWSVAVASLREEEKEEEASIVRFPPQAELSLGRFQSSAVIEKHLESVFGRLRREGVGGHCIGGCEAEAEVGSTTGGLQRPVVGLSAR